MFELRNLPNIDLYTITIVISLVLLLLAKYIFRFEYQKFISFSKSESFNNIFVYLISNLCYLSLAALILFPLLKGRFKQYFEYQWQLFLFCLIGLIFLALIKLVIKYVWFSSFENFNHYILNITQKSFVSLWKYFLSLAFIILFFYTPANQYYSDQYALLFFIGMYIIDIGFEFERLPHFNFGIGLYKFLYLCTLEILPVLVFLKLIFTIS